MKHLKRTALMLGAAASLSYCKPPKGSSSDVASVVGVGADGKESAFALLPVRNYTYAHLAPDSQDPGVQQAAAMVRTRMLAIVECSTTTNGKGETLSAADLLAAAEVRASLDDLYIDSHRYLLTSANDGRLAQIGNAGIPLVIVPCHVFGSRMLSWDVLADIQVRAAGMPKTMPANGPAAAEVASVFRTSEAVELSIRGSYMSDPSQSLMAAVPAVMNMLSEQAGETVNADEIVQRIKLADGIYVPDPCNTVKVATTELPYVGPLRAANYACASNGHGGYDYRAGGSSGTGYVQMLNLLANEIATTHEQVVFKNDGGSDPALAALWDALTSTTPWTAGSSLKGRISDYLRNDTSEAQDFVGVFSSNSNDARFAPAQARPRADLRQAAAPFGIATHMLMDPNAMWASRMEHILRAPANGDTRRYSVLEGGSTSTYMGLAGDLNGRIRSLGRYMGPAGANGIQAQANAVAGAMRVIQGK